MKIVRRVRTTAGLAILLVAFLAPVLQGCQSTTGRTAGQTIDDASITAAVKGKLVAEKMSNLVRVDVDTNRGTVYLTGVVETPDDKDRATQLARAVDGVRDVVNNLQVQRAG